MRLFKIIKYFLIIFFLINHAYANTNYYDEGLILFKKNEFDKAKFKFEQDLVFNPKNENAYLYLSKIFKIREKNKLEEQNLNSVILLNPKNEEALYSLAKLKLKESDYTQSKKLILQSLTFCKNYCEELKKLKIELEKLIKK